MKISQYFEGTWAVRRWDRFNGGKQVVPRSFCQFWRTILLWATLASLPLVGQQFRTHLIEEKPIKEWDSNEHARQVAALRKVVTPPALFVWWLLWPIRIVLYGAWRTTATVIAFVDERDTRRLETVLGGAALLVVVGLCIYTVVMLGIVIVIAWMASWPIFLAVVLGVPLSLAIMGFLALRYGYSIVSGVRSFFQLIWGIAVTSKHRVCPPMVIVRNR